MKLFAASLVAFTVFAATAFAQQSPQTPVVMRIPAAMLSQLSPAFAPGADSIQVLVKTANPATAAIRVTLTYSVDGKEVTAVSERPVSNGIDIHLFFVPSYQAPIVSVNVKELAVITEQTFTGF